jgi:hypothetical protein
MNREDDADEAEGVRRQGFSSNRQTLDAETLTTKALRLGTTSKS